VVAGCRTSLAESVVDNGLLEAVKRWLEPLPDRSLPAVNIQRELFSILRNVSHTDSYASHPKLMEMYQLPIETSTLKSSGLGKVVYFYTKCKRVEPFITRMASQLVSDWMRPIIRRSKAFTDKVVSTNTGAGSDSEDETGLPGPRVENASASTRHARVPEMLTQSFRNAPVADPSQRKPSKTEDRMGASHAQGHSERMKVYKKKLIAGSFFPILR